MFIDPFYTNPEETDYRIWGQFLTGEKKRIQNDQGSTHDQLKDLFFVAIKIGKYDAAEFLKKMLQNDENNMDCLKEYRKT